MYLQKITMGTLIALAARESLQSPVSLTAVAQTPPSINIEVVSTNSKFVKTIAFPSVENETVPVFTGKSTGVNLNTQIQQQVKETNLFEDETVVSYTAEGVPVITPSNFSDNESAGESWVHDDREPNSIDFSRHNQQQVDEDASVHLSANISLEPAPVQESSNSQSLKVTTRLDALRNQIDLYQQNAAELPPLGSPDMYLPDVPPLGFIWPTRGVLTSGYGMRWGRMHAGIDIAAPIGTPIFAAASGVVTYAGWNNGGYGNLVEIRHANGSITRYGHNNRVLVRKGQQVEQNQQIAEMGSTGYSTGPHCHFEIHPSGRGAVDPIAFLPRENNTNRRISQGW